MARKLRLEYCGAIYHVLNPGDRREPIFQTNRDRALFLDTLAEICRKTDEAWAEHPQADKLRLPRWSAVALAQRRKGDAGKLTLARRPWQETKMTRQWIAISIWVSPVPWRTCCAGRKESNNMRLCGTDKH